MEENQVIPNPNPQFTERKNNSSKTKNAVMIVAGLILLTLLVVGAYFLGKGSTNSQSETTPTPELTFPTFSVSDTPTETPKLTSTPSASTTVTLTPSPNIKTKIISSTSALDGFRSSNNGGNATLEIRAGRNSNLVTRGFVSFDLTNLPQGVTIEEASLRLYQAKIVGNPYTSGGQLKVDHLNYGDSLDSEDYGLAALSSSFATLTSNQTVEWKDLNVTDHLKDDLANGRSRSQFRIHFQTESTGGDVTGDFTYFESEDNSQGTGNTPQLVVKYY